MDGGPCIAGDPGLIASDDASIAAQPRHDYQRDGRGANEHPTAPYGEPRFEGDRPEQSPAAPGPARPDDAVAAGTQDADPDLPPQRIVEALLFASSDPLPAARIAQVLNDADARDVRRFVAELNQEYEARGAAYRVQELAGGFQLRTLPEYSPWLSRLVTTRQDTRLSAASLETLAVVAYKQPVTRAEIEAIRGVGAGEVLNRLREMDLIRIVGRAEDLGRPMLYGTTRRFLELFGLARIEDLPRIEGPLLSAQVRGAGNVSSATEAESIDPEHHTADDESPAAGGQLDPE